jgi:lysophospholipase L1-like esterase
MLRIRRSALLAAVVALAPVLGAVSVPHTAAQASAGLVGPKQYYLALGDSLAYGFQPNFRFGLGYADDWQKEMQTGDSALTLINMGCVGETLETFMNGKCPAKFFNHYRYKGAQFPAALQFLQQHAGQVSPVTIDIGANDFIQWFDPNSCTMKVDPQQINSLIATYDISITTVLSQLKSALNGTGDLFTMNYYDPFASVCASHPDVLNLIATLNQHLAADVQSVGVPMADVFDAFGGNNPGQLLCNYTWMCRSWPKNVLPRIHPRKEGYKVIFQQFQALAGY